MRNLAFLTFKGTVHHFFFFFQILKLLASDEIKFYFLCKTLFCSADSLDFAVSQKELDDATDLIDMQLKIHFLQYTGVEIREFV